MKGVLTVLVITLTLFSCGQGSVENDKTEAVTKRQTAEVDVFSYDSLTLPHFFTGLTNNHLRDFIRADSGSFALFCHKHDLDTGNAENIRKYYAIHFLHELFTSGDAVNCSRAGILRIPYMWHYSDPNPRYKIRFVSDGQLLRETPPPKTFTRYASFADIDRTPYLFLSDLLTAQPRYYSEACDTFYTFGWCSEREMAFVALTTLMGYESRIITGVGHTWTEIPFSMVSRQGNEVNFLTVVDNTFDIVSWYPMSEEDINNWRKQQGENRLARWYEEQASSPAMLEKLREYPVPPSVSERIEQQVVEWLEKRFSQEENLYIR